MDATTMTNFTGKDLHALTTALVESRRLLQDRDAADAAITQVIDEIAQRCPVIPAAKDSNETERFGRLARSEDFYERLGESIRQMYCLAESARHESLARDDKLNAVCANMVEITKIIPTHLEQIEQEQSTRETKTGRASLRLLAQLQKASEDLNAVVQEFSSHTDSWVDMEQSLERIISIIKPDGPNAFGMESIHDKFHANQRMTASQTFYHTVPATNGLGDLLGVDQLKRHKRVRPEKRETENDKGTTNEEESTMRWQDRAKEPAENAQAKAEMGAVFGILELVGKQLKMELVGEREERLRTREKEIRMREEKLEQAVKRLEGQLALEKVKKSSQLVQPISHISQPFTTEPESLCPGQLETGKSGPAATFGVKSTLHFIRRHTN